MKRTHTQEPARYGHHERASVAVRIAREVRKLFAPIYLKWLARQDRYADEHFADMASSCEWMAGAMKRIRHEQARIEERRRQVQTWLT